MLRKVKEVTDDQERLSGREGIYWHLDQCSFHSFMLQKLIQILPLLLCGLVRVHQTREGSFSGVGTATFILLLHNYGNHLFYLKSISFYLIACTW